MPSLFDSNYKMIQFNMPTSKAKVDIKFHQDIASNEHIALLSFENGDIKILRNLFLETLLEDIKKTIKTYNETVEGTYLLQE
jgi:hypothetical protein